MNDNTNLGWSLNNERISLLVIFLTKYVLTSFQTSLHEYSNDFIEDFEWLLRNEWLFDSIYFNEGACNDNTLRFSFFSFTGLDDFGCLVSFFSFFSFFSCFSFFSGFTSFFSFLGSEGGMNSWVGEAISREYNVVKGSWRFIIPTWEKEKQQRNGWRYVWREEDKDDEDKEGKDDELNDRRKEGMEEIWLEHTKKK